MENKDYEFVHHPEHYQSERGECIDCMREDLGDEVALHFCQGSSYKYRFRAGDKPGESAERDLGKAENYDAMAEEINKDYHDGWIPCKAVNGYFYPGMKHFYGMVDVTTESGKSKIRCVKTVLNNHGKIETNVTGTIIAYRLRPKPYKGE